MTVLANTDSFGRLRVSEPHTLFDSKQVFDSQPLFWNDVEASGGGTSSTHSANRASTALGVSEDTAGSRVRQTYRRFNYEPGKSQLVFMTFVLGAQASGVTKRVGQFDASNGVFLEQDGDTGLVLVRRTNISGTPAEERIPQAEWSLDPLDGSGPTGVILDPTKSAIFVCTYEWLGVGRYRAGFDIGGTTIYVHDFLQANKGVGVYMSTPNLPLRYEITHSGTGAAASLEAICASVISEGGTNSTGRTTYISNGGTHVDCDVADTIYALVGIRLKAAYLGATVQVEDIACLTETATPFEWLLIWKPTVAGTFAYSDVTNSAVQRAVGATANTVTGGLIVAGGYVPASATTRASVSAAIKSALILGSSIAGTVDEMVLCARPLAVNADISGGITIRELL